jgi:hypothetical protein
VDFANEFFRLGSSCNNGAAAAAAATTQAAHHHHQPASAHMPAQDEAQTHAETVLPNTQDLLPSSHSVGDMNAAAASQPPASTCLTMKDPILPNIIPSLSVSCSEGGGLMRPPSRPPSTSGRAFTSVATAMHRNGFNSPSGHLNWLSSLFRSSPACPGGAGGLGGGGLGIIPDLPYPDRVDTPHLSDLLQPPDPGILNELLGIGSLNGGGGGGLGGGAASAENLQQTYRLMGGGGASSTSKGLGPGSPQASAAASKQGHVSTKGAQESAAQRGPGACTTISNTEAEHAPTAFQAGGPSKCPEGASDGHVGEVFSAAEPAIPAN